MIDGPRVGLDRELYDRVARCSICYSSCKDAVSCCFFYVPIPIPIPISVESGDWREEN